LSFLWILLKNFYFLPCGFDHDEVVPIKAHLESWQLMASGMMAES
jgi:hypothetical protein